MLKVLAKALRNRALSPTDRVVLCAHLGNLSEKRGIKGWLHTDATARRVSEETGLSMSTVRAANRRLREAGIVEVQRAPGRRNETWVSVDRIGGAA